MKLLGAGVISAFLLPAAFYGYFEFAAGRIVKNHDLPRQSRNSVKHAYTAASVYNILRQMNLGEDTAERAVLSLGVFNETVETYVKVGKRDSASEMKKDLFNNWAGIVATQWILDQPEHVDIDAVIANLAHSKILMLQAPDTRPSDADDAPTVASAEQWFLDRRSFFADRIVQALENEPSSDHGWMNR